MCCIAWIIAIVFLSRRSRYSRLTSLNYPALPVEQFEDWQRSELRSIDSLWIVLIPDTMLSLGLLLYSMVVSGAFNDSQSQISDPPMAFYLLFVVDFVLCLLAGILSAIFASKAAHLRRRWNIVPPP